MLIRCHEGDLLHIAVTPERATIGQVVKKLSMNILLGVFDSLYESKEEIDIRELDIDTPIFLAETMDTSIEDGVWRIVGNRQVSPHIPIPVYKIPVGLQGEYHLQDVYGQIIRRLTEKEARLLRSPKSYSPALVEGAVRAFYGYEPWLPLYEELAL
jgi:hypothetical protein